MIRTQIPTFILTLSTLTYSSSFPLTAPFPCTLSHTNSFLSWLKTWCALFWQRNAYSLFSTGFLHSISEMGKCFFMRTSVLYPTCFSSRKIDSGSLTTPHLQLGITSSLSLSTLQSYHKLSQTGQNVLQRPCLENISDCIFAVTTLPSFSKEGKLYCKGR